MKIKKLMSLLLTAALVLSLATPLFAGVEGPNYGVIPHATMPIKVDGIRDEAYTSNGNCIFIIDKILNGIDTHVSAEVFLTYYGDTLYAFVQVSDPDIVVPDADHSRNPWDYDNVELFIDYSGNCYSDAYAYGTGVDTLDQCVQYRVDVSGYPSVFGRDVSGDSWCAYGANDATPGAEADDYGRYASAFFQYAGNFASSVYTIEYAIPLTNTNLPWGTETLTAGDTFGLNVMITDFYTDCTSTTVCGFSHMAGLWSWDAHLWPEFTLGERPEYLIEVISEDEKTAKITGYNGTATDIEIPSEINGYTITEIGREAFFKNTNLKSLVLNEGLLRIESNAFALCYNMASVSFPDSLEFIDTDAFRFCEYLQEIHLPAKVDLGLNPFWGCYSLSEISVDANNPYLTAIDNILYSKSGSLLVYPAGSTVADFVVPENVKDIGYHAFAFSKLQTITFSKNVQAVNGEAFWNCDYLKSINVDAENQIFKSVDGVLYTVDGWLVQYPANRRVDTYEVIDGTTTIVGSSFMRTSLKAIVFPASLNTLNESFNGVTTLESACFKGAVPSEWYGSFRTETTLYYIEGQEGWTSPTFAGPYGMVYNTATWDGENIPINTLPEDPNFVLEFTSDKKAVIIKQYIGSDSNVIIPAEIGGYPVTEIGYRAFAYNNNLKSVVIPGSVRFIGNEAFLWCENLISVKLNEGLQVIDNMAFWGCAISEITLPNSLVELRYNSLGNTRLNYIHIPANVQNIDEAFWMCGSLSEITVDSANKYFYAIDNVLYYYDGTYRYVWIYPSGLTAKSFVVPEDVSCLRSAAFGFSKLESIVLHDGLKEIGHSTFWQCNNLLEITIPAEVYFIGNRPFSHCYSLKNINVAEGNENFYSKDGVLYRNDGTLISYPGGKTDLVLEIPEGVTRILDSAITNNTLAAIVCPEGMDSIEYMQVDNLKGVFFKGSAPSNYYAYAQHRFPLYYIEGQSGWTTPEWALPNAGYPWTTKTWDGENLPKSIYCDHALSFVSFAPTCVSAGKVASNGQNFAYYCSDCDLYFADSNKMSVLDVVDAAVDPYNHEGPYVLNGNIECGACGEIAIKVPEATNLGTVPHFETAPTLDGVKDDVYSDGVIIPVDSVVRGIDTGLNAEASVLFSNGYLYVFMDVNDPDLVIPDAGRSKNPWDYENVELFIDFSGNAVSDSAGVDRDYLSSAMQFRVDASGYQSVYFRDNNNDTYMPCGDGIQAGSTTDGTGGYASNFFESETKISDDGYTIEYKIPLTNTMLDWGEDTIVSGDKFGINIQITDFHTGSSETSGYVLEDFTGGWAWDVHLWPELTLGEGIGGSPVEKIDIYAGKNEVELVKTPENSVVVDGKKDDAYAHSNMIEVKEQNLDSWDESPADTEAKVWTLWDDEYLYIFGELKDSDIYTEHEGNPNSIWSGDKLDIFVDFDYNRTPEYSYSYDDNGDNVAFLAIAPDGGANFFTGYHLLQEDLPYYDLVQTSAVIDADAGLVYYEARIPLPEDHVAIEDGMKIGFEVAFTNATSEAENRVGCVSWSEHGGLIWKWSSPAGTAILSDSYNHNIIEHAAKDATVESEGNKLYYECELCGKLFEDADAKVETTLEKVTIPKLTNIPVSGISLSSSDLRIVSGTSAKIVAILSPENATNKNVVWTSGNKDVATVKDGVVTATGLGNTVITATTEDGEFSASCKIYVVCDHDLEAKTGAVATCSTVGIITSAGSRDYYYCSECDVCYSNEDKDQIVTLIEEAIDPDNHDIKENIAKEATYVSAGNELYYECTLCGKLYEDADCEVETDRASVIIPQMIQVSETGAVEIAVEEIEEVVVKDKATNTVTIPLENTVDHETGEVVAVSTVTLPVEVVSEATENNASLELKTSDSSIKLDTQALATVAEAVNASPESTVELKVQVGTADDSLEEEQIEAVEAHNVDEVAAVVSASIIVDGKTVGSESEGGFNGGSVTISVPFVPTEGSGSDYSILYVPDEGEAVIIDAKYDNATKCLVFTTEHLSEYAIVKLHKCNFTELKLNAAFHWYECSCGEQSAYVAHDYISKNDVKDHWAECSGCGDIIDKAAHVSSGAATETKAETCTECGYVIENALGHSCEKHLTKVPAVKATCETAGNTEYYKCECGRLYKEADAITEFFNEADTVIAAKGHVDSDKDNYCDACDKVLHVCVYKIFNDNYNHWLGCSCGDVKDVAAHIESGWIIDVAPQAFESGSRHTECRYCGMIMRAETVDRLGWYDENMFIQSCIIDKKVYTLTSSSSSGGTLSYYGDMVVRNGSVVDYTITPAAGYRIDAVYINGVNIGVVDHYTFNYIKSSATIHVDFEKIQ